MGAVQCKLFIDQLMTISRNLLSSKDMKLGSCDQLDLVDAAGGTSTAAAPPLA